MVRERSVGETIRVEAFSDGVFAISITLLGFGLKVPRAGDGRLLVLLGLAWPSFLAFFTSFVAIGIVWVNHHRLFTHIRRVSHGLLMWNGLLLMAVSLVPYTTELLAAYLGRDGARAAAVVYAASQIFITVSFNLVWRHATKQRRLVDRHLTPPMIRRINLQYGFGPVLYLASLFIALESSLASVVLDAAFAAFFALPAFTFTDAGHGTAGGASASGADLESD